MSGREKVHVRRGTPLDLTGTVRLLNEIVEAGGITAMTRPLDAATLGAWMQAEAGRAAWHVAESAGEVMGFQWIGPSPALPPEACEIATFVRVGQTGIGIGSRLFEATKRASRRLGYGWIDAEIRADNAGGLTYYQSRGFRRHAMREGVRLEDGTVVDKVRMRFDLD